MKVMVFEKAKEILWVENDHGQMIQWSAISGPWGRGALPSGIYEVSELVDIDPFEPRNAPYKDIKGRAWWMGIYAKFQTDRGGLGIHPDGNVPGTLGCIGVEGDTEIICSVLRKEGVEWKLVVI